MAEKVEGATLGTHAMTLVPDAQARRVSLVELRQRLTVVCLRHLEAANAEFVADKIVMAEQMGIPTHGLHYFLHSILPHLEEGRINDGPITVRGSVVYSVGSGGIGFLHLQQCLLRASEVARETGVGLAVMRLPGKVGALRVFCPEFMARGQLVLMLKNTARTVGLAETGEPIFGTNPLCIGLPETDFIYDSSIATVATNKIRLARKTQQQFPAVIGVDEQQHPTADPAATVGAGGYLLPFSFGPYWFKSFFLGVAIEAMAALAGGRTGSRVGEHTGQRLFSREGMLALLVDRSALPDYADYLEEVGHMLTELDQAGLRVPGRIDPSISEVNVFADDWQQLLAL
jgi:LDH2 family malate/lactate/ureidoglycolate dehydrogenase